MLHAAVCALLHAQNVNSNIERKLSAVTTVVCSALQLGNWFEQVMQEETYYYPWQKFMCH